MIVQLFAVTGLLYVSWLPISIATVINILHTTPVLQELHANWFLIGLIYLTVLLSPLTTTIAIPELRMEIRAWIQRWQGYYNNRRIQPTATTVQIDSLITKRMTNIN
ncbi:unnamed protein product [Rotaria sp. Silwood2]|nr:unnamed protein product [Rotaria sp. Silwood2]CAF3189620.1 unnamed protein product [Rotaria sp. Silwood2]CAF4323313.1 unnamed protein product [Rotaria sp. Silwood2]CAF4489251.1 unnamed protein product [Rotaria sp. Silwood2]